MRERLDDLRHLKLAEMYELAYERFILDVALRTVADERVREGLLRLAPAGESHHDRLATEMERLNAALTPEEAADVTRAALLDVLEVERAARDMYLRLADKVHDPRLVRLFRDLAKEEEGHARHAMDLLALFDERAARPRDPGDPPRGLSFGGGPPRLFP